ncbi:MAG: acetylglutamate kinase [Muribaculaceae bacterium]|nr:acetylglutamate kinase [Muribaculaceae bacterium]
MSATVTIYKIGGNVVDNPEALDQFLNDFARIVGPKVLVHGGGKEATRLSKALGLETTMIDGRRVTDRETLDVVTMVYAGLINKRIVSALQARAVNAIGLTGADANVILATRRKPNPVDYGFVGDIDPADIDTDLIESFLAQGITPVFCAINHDGEGSLLNCNADSVAASIAKAMARVTNSRLVYCFEKDGVLADVDDPKTLIPLITPENYETLREEGAVSAGMIPKIDNAFDAINQGVESVTIKNSVNLTKPIGTIIALS